MVCSGGTWSSIISYSSTGGAQLANTFGLPSDIAPTSISASQNDYNPANLSTAAVLRLTASGAYNITGLQGGTDGRVLTLTNIGTNAITLVSESASSTAANRFALAANIPLSQNQSVVLLYDSTAQRWRVMANYGTATASAGGSDRQIQFNNSTALGGISNLVYNTNGTISYSSTHTESSNSARYAIDSVYTVQPTANHDTTAEQGTRASAIRGYGYVPTASTFNVNKVVGLDGLYWGQQTSGTVGEAVGVQAWAGHASGTVSYLRGLYAGASVSAGTATNVFGVSSNPRTTGGTVGTMYGIWTDAYNDGATLTTLYGNYINVRNVSGTTTNRYGLYLVSPTGSATNDWGIYQSGSQDNRLNGALGVGTSPTAAKLQVYEATGTGISLAVDGATAMGVYAYAGHTTGANYGVYGQSASSAGAGVAGQASSASGGNGVSGISAAGHGVTGWTSGTTGNLYGVYGQSASSTGRGVYGYASHASGANMGVMGYVNSTSGYGVYGQNAAASGYGVYCNSGNTNGCGGNRNWFNSSDVRLKDHIAELGSDDGLAAVMKLRPVRYEWKDKVSAGKPELGFIAQDVEKVLPELVGTGLDQDITLTDGSTLKIENVKVMSYGQVTVPLVKAVQELKAENDELRDLVTELRAINDNLEQRVERLEAEAR